MRTSQDGRSNFQASLKNPDDLIDFVIINYPLKYLTLHNWFYKAHLQ